MRAGMQQQMTPQVRGTRHNDTVPVSSGCPHPLSYGHKNHPACQNLAAEELLWFISLFHPHFHPLHLGEV